jgi:phage-related protein
MAVVGEAKIIVSAVTRGVGPQIKAAMAGAEASMGKDGERVGQTLARGVQRGVNKKGGLFSGFKKGFAGGPEVDSLTKKLHALQRTGYFAQAAIGALAGSVGALIGGLGALAGALGGAIPAAVGLAGAFIGLKIGASLAGMALKGVTGPMNQVGKAGSGTTKTIKELREEMQQLRFDAEDAALSEKEAALNLEKARNELARVQDLPPNSMARREAELAYEQADLALRRAIDRNNDLQDQIANGGKDAAKANAGVDPYAGLTESQKKFAKLLVQLKPKFDELKEAVAKGFLYELGNQLKDFMKGDPFKVLKSGFSGIGDALGSATKSLGDYLKSAEGLNNLDALFKSSKDTITIFGRVLTNGLAAFLDILNVAAPLTHDFVAFLEKKTETFRNFIATKKASGELADFFARAKELAGGFGKVFGNIFGGFGKIIQANFDKGSGGDILLTWLQTATEKFKNIDQLAGGKNKLREYFIGAAENMKSMFQTIGGLVGILVRMGNMPEVKQFWDTMRGGLPALESILRSGQEAAPWLARLLVAVTKIMAAFGDADGLKIFIGIFAILAEAIAKFVEIPVVKTIINWISKFGAAALAIGSILTVARLLGTYIGGRLRAALSLIAAHPIIATLIILGGLFYMLYKSNKQFADSVNEAWSQLKPMFEQLGTQLAGVGTQLMGALTGILDGLQPVFTGLVNAIVKVMPMIVQFIGAIMEIIPPILSAVIPVISKLVEIFSTYLAYYLKEITALFEYLLPPVMQIIQALLPLIPLLLDALVPAVTALMDVFIEIISVMGDIMPIIIQVVGETLSALVPVVVMVADAVGDLITMLAPLITQLINALMPAFKQVMGAIVPLIQTLAQALIPVIQNLVTALMPVIKALIDFLMPVFQAVVNILSGFVIPILSWLAETIGGVVIVAFNAIIGVITWLVDTFNTYLMPAIKFVGELFANVFNGLRDIFRNVVNFLIGIFEGFINFVIDGLNNFFKPLRDSVNGILDMLGVDFQFSVIPNVKIPRLADGGVVSPSQGGSLVNVAEAGKPERIEPLDENGMSKRDKAIMDMISGGGVNITVNPSAGMDETALAALVSRRIAFELRKGAIA